MRGRLLSVGALPTHLPVMRLGLRIQRGMKGSVARNRAKRLMRAAYQQEAVAVGYDLVVVIHRISGISLAQFREEFFNACKELGLLVNL